MAVLGFAQNKLFALVLGPYGLGIWSQAQTLFSTFSPIISLSASKGLVKYAAEESPVRSKGIFSTAIVGCISVFVLLLPLVVFYSSNIAGWIFNNSKLGHLVVIIYFSVVFSSISAFYDSLLQAYREIKILNIKLPFLSFVSLLLAVPMIFLARVTGIAIAMVLGSVSAVFASQLILSKLYRIAPNPRLFSLSNLKKLLKYGFTNIISSNLSSFSNLAVRLIILRVGGSEAIGLFQAADTLVSAPTNIIQTSVNRYLFPSLSVRAKTKAEMIAEENDALRITTLFITPVFAIMIVLGGLIIPFFFSSSFLGALQLLPILVLSEYIKNVVWIIGASLLPTKRIKAFLVFETIYTFSLVLLVFALALNFRLIGIVLAFPVSYILFTVIVYFYQSKTLGFYIQSQNLVLLFKSSLLILLTAIIFYLQIGSTSKLLISGGFIIAWSFLAISLKEVNQLVSFFRTELKQIYNRQSL